MNGRGESNVPKYIPSIIESMKTDGGEHADSLDCSLPSK